MIATILKIGLVRQATLFNIELAEYGTVFTMEKKGKVSICDASMPRTFSVQRSLSFVRRSQPHEECLTMCLASGRIKTSR